MNLKDKKVLVTGAEGFIGSHLVERLLQENAKVKAFVYYNSFNHWGWIDTFDENIKQRIEVVTGDVRDLNSVKTAMKEIDVVFHLAALIAIPFSYAAPDSYVDTNVKGTLNILQAAREMPIQRIFITSTSEVYGTARYVPIDEMHPLQGQSPYAATKIAADKLAEAFHLSFNLPITIVRPFNTYGPRQSARAIIPTIITQLLSGKSELQLGKLSPTRDFNFVKDVCEAMIAICSIEETIGLEINIATQQEISMEDLTTELIAQINPSAKIMNDANRLRPTKSEVERLLGSNEKLKSLTRWKPAYSLKVGLAETIAWFEKNLHHYKSTIYNV